MNELTYTINKFDEDKKIIDVSFDDGSWAQLRLANPLPKNKAELEALIRDFAEPIEAIQARQAPDADLSYISAMLNEVQTTERKSLSGMAQAESILDPEAEANAQMWEQVRFKQELGDALVEFGLLTQNPTVIPTTVK